MYTINLLPVDSEAEESCLVLIYNTLEQKCFTRRKSADSVVKKSAIMQHFVNSVLHIQAKPIGISWSSLMVWKVEELWYVRQRLGLKG